MFRVVLCNVKPLSGGCCPRNKHLTWRIGNIARAFWVGHGLTGLLNACSVDGLDADCTQRSQESKRLLVHEDHSIKYCQLKPYHLRKSISDNGPLKHIMDDASKV